jgi:CheY-like chemotaxis protein
MPEGADEGSLGGRCVLVVEDEFLIALDLSQTLSAAGCEVLGPAPTVEDALRIIEAGPALDAVVLDINLGGVRAVPVAEALAARGVPFLAATAYHELPEPVFAGVPVLSKPYGMVQVREALLRLMVERASRGPG